MPYLSLKGLACLMPPLVPRRTGGSCTSVPSRRSWAAHARNRAPSHFDGDHGAKPSERRGSALEAYADIGSAHRRFLAMFAAQRADPRHSRADAQKGAHQRRRTLRPISSCGRPANPWCMTTPSTAATMPKPAALPPRCSRSLTAASPRGRGPHVQFIIWSMSERLHASGDGHAQGVAH